MLPVTLQMLVNFTNVTGNFTNLDYYLFLPRQRETASAKQLRTTSRVNNIFYVEAYVSTLRMLVNITNVGQV
jgi:hypothetical protein